MTVLLVADVMMPLSLSGSFFISNFLSVPIRLVKSKMPLPLPSASFFSQTLNETPQLEIVFTILSKWVVVRWRGALFRFSFLSLLIASLTRFFVSLSVISIQNLQDIRSNRFYFSKIILPVILSIKCSSSRTTFSKARRTRAHLSRVLVIRDKLDRQNFLVCGQHLRHFRHSWHVNQISNMFDIFRHSWNLVINFIIIKNSIVIKNISTNYPSPL